MASPHDLEFGQEGLKKAVKEAVCFHDPVCASSAHLLCQRLCTLKVQWNPLGALLKRILGLTVM